MQANPQETFLTSIPARLDRLPWSRFHWLVIMALGVTWILDGLEVTLIGAISGVLGRTETLSFSPEDIGWLASFYLIGTVSGAVVFGYLTDLWGRQRLFYLTLIFYSCGVLLSALSWNLISFCVFRFLTGAGIGGEYAAINSAVDELIPARVRGRVNLMVNGSYWLGAALASVSTFLFLDPKFFSVDLGWRVAFAVGGVMGFLILFLRRFVPESPRWLILHGRPIEAEQIVAQIEQDFEQQSNQKLPVARNQTLVTVVCKRLGLRRVIAILAYQYRRSSMVSLMLIVAQAFMYNAIFFTYTLILTKFYQVPPAKTGLYLLPFAISNFLGPLCLGFLFDRIGRRVMISFTYAISGVLLIVTGWMFAHLWLTAATQTLLWSGVFFFGSAAASSAYLTVSEIFPLETRGLAIALFYALGTGVGGILAPLIFGLLISDGSHWFIFYGYLFAACLMIIAGTVQAFYGVDAEGKSLEQISQQQGSEQCITMV